MAGRAYDVVVAGSVNVDLVVGVERRPGAGETVLGSDLATHPGGKGANQAVAAARLGGRVAFLGRAGTDGNGDLVRETLRRDGVDTAHLTTTPAPNGVALITVDPSGDNSIIVSPGANAKVTEEDVAAARSLFADASVVSLQLEIPLAAVVAAARTADEEGARVVFNLSPAADVPDELIARCDPLVVNEHEAEFLGDTRPAGLLARGARSVVITRGADGAVVADANGVTEVPSPRVDVVDTTGAGDAFTGALCLRLARGDDLATAARFAARVGAAAVRKAGAQSSFPAPEDLKEL
ncbi:ribokinase [Actinoallomurus sp. NBC_01490]|uniref:ribokinase n=1 Tax=Actinoallomurus sp. NBC_01490 TaxID=2903557 RepID=UPI002E370BEE|nr:ribokinase [Actinoallomurus sp. NBC_01490]